MASPSGTRFGALVAMLAALGVLGGMTVTVFWTEAEREIEVLCSMVDPGDDVTSILRMLDTGNLLRYRFVEGVSIAFESPWNAYGTRCDARIAEDAVAAADYTERFRLRVVAGAAAAVLMGALAVFQLLLATGAPIGSMAWGGGHDRLPSGLRWASAASVGVLGAGIAAVLQAAGLLGWGLPTAWVGPACWALTVLFLLSVVGNLLSSSARERRVLTPVAILLTIACFAVAFGA